MMQAMPFAAPQVSSTEWAAALLQGAITTGLAGLSAHLYARYGRPWFRWFAVAWGVYVARLLCILIFLRTEARVWLYWHQVTTGWTALALLWAAMVFLRQPTLQRRYLWVLLFPPVWSFVAIYELDHFLWAALPAVLFLSGATLWTGWVFWRHHRTVTSAGARLLAVAFLLWGLHHLDYPFLRARGAWMPWGYYLDIAFELLVGAGLVLLVLDDLGRGVRALAEFSGDLQRRAALVDPTERLLARPLELPGVRGSALIRFDDPAAATGRVMRGAGSCAAWAETGAPPAVHEVLVRLVRTERPVVASGTASHPFIAALPVESAGHVAGALVMTGDVRNPFTALTDDFLVALGRQVGAALEQYTLDQQLEARTTALEHLSARMVRQHEDERRRLSRELHDETAQVFSAVKMQLEALRPLLPDATARLDRLLVLVDHGIASIRQVTSDLRPSLLDDLGLLPALRSLMTEFAERGGLTVTLHAPEVVPALVADADLALFRALQEALSNVARHAHATTVSVTLTVHAHRVEMRVEDNGVGFPVDAAGRLRDAVGRMGLTGMRERVHAVGGSVTRVNTSSGACVMIEMPVRTEELI